MWWDGMLSLLADLLDPKGGRKIDLLTLFVLLVILVVIAVYGYRWLHW